MADAVISAKQKPVAPQHLLATEKGPGARGWLTPFRAHLGSLLVGGGILAYADRNDWFFQDDWDFLFKRGFHHPTYGIWIPHNEHWSTLPILLFRAVVSINGLHSIVPTLAALLIAHLCVCHLLWRISLRCQVDAWIATSLVTVFVLLGSGADNLTWDFQIGFIGSVLFGLAAVQADRLRLSPTSRVLIGWVLLVCSLMCSGIGITMTLASGLDQMYRRGFRAAALTLSVPSAIYLVWFTFAGRSGLSQDVINLTTLLAIPSYAWTGLSSSLGNTFGLDTAGPVLLLVLLAWGVRNAHRGKTTQATTLALGSAAVILYIVIGIARTSFGTDQATASRYTYIAIALLLPMAGLALSDLIRTSGASGRLILCGLLGFVLVANVQTLWSLSQAVGTRDQQLKVELLAAAKVLGDGDRALTKYVVSGPNASFRDFASVTSTELLQAERARQLPRQPLSPTEIVAAQSMLNISLTRTAVFSRLLLSPPPPPHQVCVTAGIFSVSVPRGGGSLVLSSARPITLGVRLQAADGAKAPVVNFSFPAGKSAVNISAANTTAVLQASTLPGFTYCPPSPES